jgi:DNA/RNA-binding domain of Phe-tRNA-synthetase-like protein
MRFSFSPEFATLFPEYTRWLVVVQDMDNHCERPELADLLHSAAERVRADTTLAANPAAHARLAAWREAFRRFGAKPADTRPALESLVRRVLKGDEISYINTAVALMNTLSLEHLLPCGGDDLGRVVGDFGLRLARGDEAFTPFIGGETEHPNPGEVILADDASVMCRRWIWRQGDQTKITPDTTSVVINVDVFPPATVAEGEDAARKLVSRLEQFCGARASVFLLDKNHLSAEW